MVAPSLRGLVTERVDKAIVFSVFFTELSAEGRFDVGLGVCETRDAR